MSMARFECIRILNCDGVADSANGSFMPGSVVISGYHSGPVEDNVGKVLGYAAVREDVGLSSIMAMIEIQQHLMPYQEADLLVPSVKGSILQMTGNRIDRAEITGIMLAPGPNTDRRILSMQAQRTFNPQRCKLLFKQPDGSFKELVGLKTSINYHFSVPTDEVKTASPGSAPKKTCYVCSRELSATLDAYYGKNTLGSKHCLPCRQNLGI